MTGDAVYLRHILDAIAKIETYTAIGERGFLAESHWHDATIRQLEIIGEATKRLSTSTKDRYPHVPWRRMAGLRDVLIHNYFGVDLDYEVPGEPDCVVHTAESSVDDCVAQVVQSLDSGGYLGRVGLDAR